jgi:hypothetical protein
MRNLVLVPAFVLATLGIAASAQQPAAGAKVESEPGKVASTRTVTATAEIVGMDYQTRTVTLRGSKGAVFDVVAGDEVKNFDQLRLGDRVVAKYQQAFSAEVQKTGPAVRERIETTTPTRSQPGETPSVGKTRQVTVLATVVAVDPPKRTMTIRGPRNTVTIHVDNPMHFNVVKPGDQIAVTYTEALALSLEPAPKPAAKK